MGLVLRTRLKFSWLLPNPIRKASLNQCQQKEKINWKINWNPKTVLHEAIFPVICNVMMTREFQDKYRTCCNQFRNVAKLVTLFFLQLATWFFVARQAAERRYCTCNFVCSLPRNGVALQVAEKTASCNSTLNSQKDNSVYEWGNYFGYSKIIAPLILTPISRCNFLLWPPGLFSTPFMWTTIFFQCLPFFD